MLSLFFTFLLFALLGLVAYIVFKFIIVIILFGLISWIIENIF